MRAFVFTRGDHANALTAGGPIGERPRRSVRFGFLVGLCALAGCNPPSPQMAAGIAENPAASESELRPLTDVEISALLSGACIREIVPANVQDLSTPEQFNRDGTYIRYADNAELEGHYTVRNGTVCVKDEVHPEYCRFVAVDAAGRYYLGRSLLRADLKPFSRLPALK